MLGPYLLDRTRVGVLEGITRRGRAGGEWVLRSSHGRLHPRTSPLQYLKEMHRTYKHERIFMFWVGRRLQRRASLLLLRTYGPVRYGCYAANVGLWVSAWLHRLGL